MILRCKTPNSEVCFGPTNSNRERSCIGRGLSAIRVGDNLDCEYLLYLLRFYEPVLAQAGTGSTFAVISRDDLERIRIPLPALSQQKRIVALLVRADRLRQLRRAGRELSDGLLRAIFLEMFGDRKSLDLVEFEEILGEDGREAAEQLFQGLLAEAFA